MTQINLDAYIFVCDGTSVKTFPGLSHDSSLDVTLQGGTVANHQSLMKLRPGDHDTDTELEGSVDYHLFASRFGFSVGDGLFLRVSKSISRAFWSSYQISKRPLR